MEEFYNTTHYLRLAYLAEVAIVINLAYLELKSKQNFLELNEKLKSPVLTTLLPSVKGHCTKKSKCNACTNKPYLETKFEKIDVKYISRMGRELHSMNIEEDNNGQKFFKWQWTPLWYAWYFAECKFLVRPLLLLFQALIKRNLDRFISKIALVVTTVLLVLMTMIDSNIFNGLVAKTMKFAGFLNWTFLIWGYFTFSIGITGFFWVMWNKFFKEYECLGYLLAEAYQAKSPGTLSEFINELK